MLTFGKNNFQLSYIIFNDNDNNWNIYLFFVVYLKAEEIKRSLNLLESRPSNPIFILEYFYKVIDNCLIFRSLKKSFKNIFERISSDIKYHGNPCRHETHDKNDPRRFLLRFGFLKYAIKIFENKNKVDQRIIVCFVLIFFCLFCIFIKYFIFIYFFK